MIRGLVLAGGKSSRFGSDKSKALYEGRTLLGRAVDLLNELDLKPVVAVRKNASALPLDCVSIEDQMPDEGPLGGLYTALSVFKDCSFLVLTCDMPVLTCEILETLLHHHEEGRKITLFSLNEMIEPFPGIYSHELLDRISARLTNGELSMHGLIEAVPERKELFWNGNPAYFKNVNFDFELDQKVFLNCP